MYARSGSSQFYTVSACVTDDLRFLQHEVVDVRCDYSVADRVDLGECGADFIIFPLDDRQLAHQLD